MYVFCLHHHTDKSTINPLDLDQWTFFVVANSELEARFEALNKIGMRELQAMEVVGVDFQGLKVALAKLQALGLGVWWAGLAGFAAAFALRAGAIVLGWRLPGFPGRAPPERP